MGNWTPSSLSRAFGLADLREEKVFDDKFIVVAPRTIKSIDQLLDASRSGLKVMVQTSGLLVHRKVTASFRHQWNPADASWKSERLKGLLGCVETGVGVATMPESFVRPLLRGRKVALLVLPKDVATTQIFVISSRSSESSLLVNAFLDHCRGAKLLNSEH